MTTYASNTEVSTRRSRDEIERTLTRFGATQFAYGWSGDQTMIGFVVNGRQIRFVLPLPDRKDTKYTRSPNGRARSETASIAAWDQAVKQRWRALALVIKAKLAAVEAGIVSFEEEFAVHVVMPDNRTVGEHVLPAIETAYATGTVPSMLALGS